MKPSGENRHPVVDELGWQEFRRLPIKRYGDLVEHLRKGTIDENRNQLGTFADLEAWEQRELLWAAYPQVVGRERRREKGQFFTPLRVVQLALSAIPSRCETILDPTMGHGGFLRVAQGSFPGARLTGVEVDPLPLSVARLILPRSIELHQADFTAWAVDELRRKRRFDAIVGNPPYVGYQNLNAAGDTESYRQILLQRIHEASEVADKSECFVRLAENFSGYSDLSLYVIALAWLLLEDGGWLSMVTANYWLERDYGEPMMSFLKETGRIHEAYIDGHRNWFADAQISTSILVYEKGAEFKIPIIHVARDLEEDVKEKRIVHAQASISDPRIPRHLGGMLSTNDEEDQPLTEVGWSVHQGLRTGCNQFFYVREINNTFEARLKANGSYKRFIFDVPEAARIPAIVSLPGDSGFALSKTDADAYLLALQDFVTLLDIERLQELYTHFEDFGFRSLPESLDCFVQTASSWIYEASGTRGTRIPNLTAVAPNEHLPKPGNGGIPRMWYHIRLSPRHFGHIIIPRVSAGPVKAYKIKEPGGVLTDANFVSLIPTAQRSFGAIDRNCLWIVLNSNRFRLWAEQNGIVMGGGALKVEASTLRTLRLRATHLPDEEAIPELSKAIMGASGDNESVLEVGQEIDNIIVGGDQAKEIRRQLEMAITHRNR